MSMRTVSAFMTSLALSLILACYPTVRGPSQTDGGFNSSSDATSSSRDASSSNVDGGSNTGIDAGALPDAVADDDSYLVSDNSGTPGRAVSGGLPDDNPNSAVHVDPFNGNTTFVRGGTNAFTGQTQGGSTMGLVVGFEELSGYFEVPTDGTNFSFFVTIGQDIRRANLTLVLIPIIMPSESDPDGGYGQALRVPCTVLQDIGSGDLQVSLSWNSDTDVDLHLVEPSGEEIYYGHHSSAAGGVLDLDSNAGCTLDHVDNENITYENVTPPSGQYIVRVDYWSDCAVTGQIDYAVTVNIHGTPQVFQGVFTSSDVTGGGQGDGVTVAQFDF